ncbi:hypothetical protein, conserved [Babesia ovata]|uniref:Uncharacterized protein n=1 Tax=Babesia ovata TaxID=189622 RepID=A0A2H6KHI5_9APIC|nr:uncharacterized protein BOVATA_039490 [Babesia ovata]GBE62456.1 hypothetical protein, conserved [Babesia ovata]
MDSQRDEREMQFGIMTLCIHAILPSYFAYQQISQYVSTIWHNRKHFPYSTEYSKSSPKTQDNEKQLPCATHLNRRVYTSLTEAPQNLKEAIDWLIALKGTDPEKNFKAMGAALHKFLADKPVGFTEVPALEKVKSISKEFMEKRELKEQPFVRQLLRRFNKKRNENITLLDRWFESIAESDYANVVEARGVTAKTIGEKLSKAVDGCEKFLENIKNPDQYESAYSPEATWEASCSKDPEACAVILVGIAPMLYTGLRSLKHASADGLNRVWLASYGELQLGEVMKAVGYKQPECGASMSRSDVFKALQSVKYDMLTIFYDLSGFWAFYRFDKAGDLKIEQSLEPEQPAEAKHPAGAVGLEGDVEPEEGAKYVEYEEGVEAEGVEEPENW